MPYEKFIETWETVNAVDPKSLVEARLQAHWASQIVAAVGEALVPARPDFSHTSMSWSPELRSLAGAATPNGSKVTLRLADLAISVHSPQGTTMTRELEGRTLADALGWVISELEKAEGHALERTPVIPDYEMPEHPVGGGARFGVPDRERLEELARWYANGASLARLVSENTLGASPVRCWPHHFDIATLVQLDPPGGDPASARSIGAGLSPGDASYREPYFYINPWPFPELREGHHELAGGGRWHVEGWFGAVLPAGSIEGSGREQGEQVLSYAKSAMAADRVILGTL